MVGELRKMKLKHLIGMKNQLNKIIVINAQYKLGDYYYYGKNIKKDLEKAFK